MCGRIECMNDLEFWMRVGLQNVESCSVYYFGVMASCIRFFNEIYIIVFFEGAKV